MAVNSLRFFVEGIPAPQGSKSYVGKGVMIESSKKVQPWRTRVAAAAREALLYSGSWEPGTDAPVFMDVTFVLQAPKRVPAARRGWPTTAPDLDKLLRSTNDALTTAGVWEDDSVLVECRVSKTYGSPTGALISVRELPHATAEAVAA